VEDFADDADGEDHTSKQQQSGLPPRRQQEDATERRRASLERSIDAALAPLRDAFLAEVERELLALMFPAMDDFEATLPTKQDVTRAPGDLRARNTTFASLFDAVERAMPSSEVRWRASAVDERDAQIGALCATLRASLQTHLVGSFPALGLAALDRVAEDVSFDFSFDALAYRVEAELASPLKVFDHQNEHDQRTDGLVRALAALGDGRVGYCAALPSWRCASSSRRPAAPASSPAASRGLRQPRLPPPAPAR